MKVFFSQGVINRWNSLPQDEVHAPSGSVISVVVFQFQFQLKFSITSFSVTVKYHLCFFSVSISVSIVSFQFQLQFQLYLYGEVCFFEIDYRLQNRFLDYRSVLNSPTANLRRRL